eukprot:s737_g1.t1
MLVILPLTAAVVVKAKSRPRTPPVGQQPPRLSDFPTDASSRRASEFEAPLLPGQLQSTLRLSETLEGAKAASQPTASVMPPFWSLALLVPSFRVALEMRGDEYFEIAGCKVQAS